MSKQYDKSYVLRDTMYNILVVLGIDQDSWLKKLKCTRSVINKNMFQVPKCNIFQIISYFLFSIWDNKKYEKEFHYFWPLKGKKEEQEFRKLCVAWLTTLSQEEGSYIPTFTPSLLLSPNLDRFYHLYLAAARLTLSKVFIQEHGSETLLIHYSKLNSKFASTYFDILVASTQRYLEIYKSRQEMAFNRRNVFIANVKILVEQNHKLRKDVENYTRYLAENPRKENCEENIKKLRELWSEIYTLAKLARETTLIVKNVLALTQTCNELDGKANIIKPPKQFIQKYQTQLGAASVDQIYKCGVLQFESFLKTISIVLQSYRNTYEMIVKSLEPQVVTFEPIIENFGVVHKSTYNSLLKLDTKIETYIMPQVQASIQELERQNQTSLSLSDLNSLEVERSSELNILRITPCFGDNAKRHDLWTQSLKFTSIEKGKNYNKHQLLRKDCDIGCSPELQSELPQNARHPPNNDLDGTPKSTVRHPTRIPTLRGSQIRNRIITVDKNALKTPEYEPNPIAGASKSPLDCIDEAKGFQSRDKLINSPLTITPKNPAIKLLEGIDTPEGKEALLIMKTVQKNNHSPAIVACVEEMTNAFEKPGSFNMVGGSKGPRISYELISSLEDDIMNESLPKFDIIDCLSPSTPLEFNLNNALLKQNTHRSFAEMYKTDSETSNKILSYMISLKDSRKEN